MRKPGINEAAVLKIVAASLCAAGLSGCVTVPSKSDGTVVAVGLSSDAKSAVKDTLDTLKSGIGGLLGLPGKFTVTMDDVAEDKITLEIISRGTFTAADIEKLRQIAKTPVRVLTPGSFHEISVARKMRASITLGDYKTAIEDYYAVKLDPGQVLPGEDIIQLAQTALTQSGNFAAVIKLFELREKKWRADGVPQGKINQHIAGVAAFHYAMLVEAGYYSAADGFLERYPARLERNGDLTTPQRLAYNLSMCRGRASAESNRGNFDQGKRLISECIANDEGDSKGIDSSRFAAEDLAYLKSVRNQAHLQAILSAFLTGQPEEARAHLQWLEQSHAGLPEDFSRITLYSAQELYYRAIGNYDRALEIGRKIRGMVPPLIKNSSVYRLNFAVVDAMNLMAANRFDEARQLLEAVPSVYLSGNHLYRDTYFALLANSRALSGQVDQNLEELEKIAKTYQLKGLDDYSSGTVYGSLVLAYAKRAQFWPSAEADKKLVEFGRKYSASVRAGRLASLENPIGLEVKELKAAEAENYLLGAVQAYGRGNATSNDVLDALSLLQSSAREDFSAAIFRQKSMPGLTEADLRQFQDLRLAKRVALAELRPLLRTGDEGNPEVAAARKKAAAASLALDNWIKSRQKSVPVLRGELNDKAPTLADVQARLGAGEAFVAYMPIEAKQYVAVVISKSGFSVKVLNTSVADINKLVKRIRDSMLPIVVPGTKERKLPEFDVVAAQTLGDAVYGSLKGLEGAREVAVAATGSLGSIPFSVLIKPAQTSASGKTSQTVLTWLNQSVAFSYQPSLVSWLGLGTASSPNYSNAPFIAWANPDFYGVKSDAQATATSEGEFRIKVKPLPDTQLEAEEIAGSFGAPAASVFSGPAATRSSVLKASQDGSLVGKKLVLFATHGFKAGEIPEIRQPFLAMAAETGWNRPSLLTLDDILSLRIQADAVVLSACNTAASDSSEDGSGYSTGNEALNGLARGFMYAGARSVLATHWEVEDSAGKALTTKMNLELSKNPKLSRAQALRESMQALMRSQKDKGHPFFWAPYVVVGDSRR